ncbi:MAG TPA: glycine zipper 2TM domain-containing protein [Arenimonas sp.]|uniref:glycine zipper 2TM domain-containing protein n=1 Tax=Arenimonas sp. TaxID=1872635 RepID=UPI002BAB0358|nr:glycine zipper 2TM domain-containing protein [Arenimonas sp.]HMB57658.1 glycine zipper 2TM domain-containing protein [Arenimonas sp.]
MNRLAVSTLALALAAASGTAFADYRDNGYDSRNNGYDTSANNDDGPRYDVAQVTSVDPIIEQDHSSQHQECWNEPAANAGGPYDNGGYNNRSSRGYNTNGYDVRSNAYGQGGNSRINTGGAVLGAIIGGALGNQAGHGDGRKAATVAGAAIGAMIGNTVANHRQNGDARYGNNSAYGYGNNNGYGNGGNVYGDNGYGNGQAGTVQRCRMVSDNGYSNGNDQRVIGYNVTYRYGGQTYHTTTAYHPGTTMRVAVSVVPQDQSHVAMGY